MGQIFLADNIPSLVLASTSSVTIASTFLSSPTRITVGGRQYKVGSTLTMSTATSGFNGLDTGAMANNTHYFVYAVVSSGAIGLVASTADPLTGPTGFSVWKHVGSFWTASGSTNVSVVNDWDYIEASLASIFTQNTPAQDGTTHYDPGCLITVPPGIWDFTAKITGDLNQSDTGANGYGLLGVVRTSANVVVESGNITATSGDTLNYGNKTGNGMVILRFRQSITSTTTYKISTRVALFDVTPAGTLTTLNIRASVIGGAGTDVGTRLSARRVK